MSYDAGGRSVLLEALVGSHNYNLNTETSDRDYKVFVAPTFDDLYSNKMFSKSCIGEDIDSDYHDIRKIPELFWKSNINFMEVLFSVEKSYACEPELSWLFDHKDELARINLPYLYDACIGMHLTKKKQIDKGTSGTVDLVEKYGYDTKSALHSIRVLDFLRRFADIEFTSFKSAIWYDDSDPVRDLLLSIKNGSDSKESYLLFAESLLDDTEKHYKDVYKNEAPNKELYFEMQDKIKNLVRSIILRG